jgi:hypothetical protein
MSKGLIVSVGKILSLFTVVALVACGKTSFSGAGKTNPQPVIASKPVPPTAPVPPVVTPKPPGCGHDGMTQAKLLTPTLDVKDVNAHLDYEVSRVDCDGVVQPFSADKILFDMDSYGMNETLAFSILGDGGVEITRGNLVRRSGSDLFGHTGTGWGYYETQKMIEAQGSKPSVTLRLRIAGQNLAPRIGSTAAANGSVAIPSFLRFGAALPVMVDVTVLHAAPVPVGAGVNP